MLSDLSEKLKAHIVRELEMSGGWLSFDRFMALALYQPGLGYYANDSVKFGSMPGSGSDFVTAPELSPWFGRTLGRQVAQALEATSCSEVWEFGAGSGALAQQILTQLDAMGYREVRYRIVDLSGTLRARQQRRGRQVQGAQQQFAGVHLRGGNARVAQPRHARQQQVTQPHAPTRAGV